jgi:hypothetical protein
MTASPHFAQAQVGLVRSETTEKHDETDNAKQYKVARDHGELHRDNCRDKNHDMDK